MKYQFGFIMAMATSIWAQVPLERSPLFGVQSKYETTYTEKSGLVKKGHILWRDLLNSCEADLGMDSNSNTYVKSRCCYKKLDELSIIGDPLFTVGGAHGMASLPKIQKFSNGTNYMVSFASAQFQKIKFVNTIQQRLVTCIHVVYENTSNINPNDYYNIFSSMDQYANSPAGADWKLEYFYISDLVKSPCEIIREWGDINKDGRASLADVTKLNKDYVSKKKYEKKYDFNNDNKLDLLDSNLLTEYVNKKLECYK